MSASDTIENEVIYLKMVRMCDYKTNNSPSSKN